MSFSVIENSVRSESGMHQFRIILPVPSAASRLVVKPRQSEGIVHFEAVTFQHSYNECNEFANRKLL